MRSDVDIVKLGDGRYAAMIQTETPDAWKPNAAGDLTLSRSPRVESLKELLSALTLGTPLNREYSTQNVRAEMDANAMRRLQAAVAAAKAREEEEAAARAARQNTVPTLPKTKLQHREVGLTLGDTQSKDYWHDATPGICTYSGGQLPNTEHHLNLYREVPA